MDALGDAIILIAPDWRVRYLNAPAERILGVSRGVALDADFWRTYPPFATDVAEEAIRATANDGKARRFELPWRVGGELRSYGVRVARDATSCVVLALSRSFEMMKNARDRALEERNEENAALRTLTRQTAEVADTAVLLRILCEAASEQCRAHGAALISMNRSDAELVTAAGLLGPATGWRFPLHGSLARDVADSRRIAMVEDFASTDRPLARRMGEISIGPLMAAPLVAHDRVLGVIVVARDRRSEPFTTRDERRLAVVADHAALALWKSQLIEQAQEADRAKGRFLATMSHELRTPLTALAGYEELLVDAVLGPLSDAQREVLERMHAVTQHLASMIEDVLSYTNLETGGEVVRPSDFLAADLLTASSAVVQPLAQQKHLSLALEPGVAPIRMTTDIDKARQILVNLATNAIKFTEAGEVRLSLSQRGDEVHFSVSDTGAGIAPADVPRLFKPFAQLDSGLTRKHGGAGLGLYIANRLAHLLRGRIDVESEPGRGATFTLVLPRE